MNYEILVNKDNPIEIEYLNEIIIPNLEEVEFSRDNDDIFKEFKVFAFLLIIKNIIGL